jgi:drug/metabolite transporter (DMT)-like permease
MRNHQLGSAPITALVLAAACWGGATVITKHVLTDVPPLTLLVLQLTVSVVFLWAIVLVQGLRLPQRSDIVRLGGIGILNPGLAYTFGLLGLTYTTASMGTPLWAAEPILILGLAWLILREHLTRTLVAFSLLAITGVVLVAGIDVGLEQTSLLLGNGLILTGVACCALYTVLTRRMVTNLDRLLIVVLQQTLALAWALAIWPLEWARGGAVSLTTISPASWGWAALSGVLYYALAFWCYIIGLKQMPASMVGLFLNLIPIFGVAGAYLFLGERLTLMQAIGGALILLAVVMVLRWQRGDATAAPAAAPTGL